MSLEFLDIVAVVCNLLQEMTDLDTLYENEDAAKDLIDELMNQRILEIVVQQGLSRLNEEDKDEADAVHNLLSVVENVSYYSLFVIFLCLDAGISTRSMQ